MPAKMKIGAVIFGNIMTDTQEIIQSENLNQTDSRATNYPISQVLRDELKKQLLDCVPDHAEVVFLPDVVEEGDVIDLEVVDAYVVYPFGGTTDILFSALFAKNRPIVLFEPEYSKAWSYGAVFYPYFVRDSREISRYLGMRQDVFVARNVANLKETLDALCVKYRINNATALCVGEPMYEPFHSWNWGYSMVKALQEKFGIKWVNISSKKFMDLFSGWNKDFPENTIECEAKIDYVTKKYSKHNSEKMFYVLRELAEQYGATGVTVNCLYSIIHTGLQATACYSLSKLNDMGIVAACEADVTTLLNMMITVFASNAPAFMLNPYLFPEDNKLLVSHCSSPTLHSYGKNQESDEFNLYDYFEMPSLPCGLQVMRRSGPVTLTGISHNQLDKMVIIKGNIVRNTAFSTCRTQCEVDIEGDIKTLVENYQGRHWALVYGDHAEKIAAANRMLDIENILI